MFLHNFEAVRDSHGYSKVILIDASAAQTIPVCGGTTSRFVYATMSAYV